MFTLIIEFVLYKLFKPSLPTRDFHIHRVKRCEQCGCSIDKEKNSSSSLIEQMLPSRSGSYGNLRRRENYLYMGLVFCSFWWFIVCLYSDWKEIGLENMFACPFRDKCIWTIMETRRKCEHGVVRGDKLCRSKTTLYLETRNYFKNGFTKKPNMRSQFFYRKLMLALKHVIAICNWLLTFWHYVLIH